jgi:SNF2 family DNA or RNA helicase
MTDPKQLAALQLIRSSSALVIGADELFELCPFQPEEMFRLQDLGDDDAVFEALRQLCRALRVYPRVVFIDPFRNAYIEKANKLMPQLVVTIEFNNGLPNRKWTNRFAWLFGEKVASIPSLKDKYEFTIYTPLTLKKLQELKHQPDEFPILIDLFLKRKTQPDLWITPDGKIRFAQDHARIWLFLKLGIKDIVYRLNGQNVSVLATDRTKLVFLLQCIKFGVLCASNEDLVKLVNLKNAAVSPAKAPLLPLSLRARFALLDDEDGALVDKSTNELVPVTVFPRTRTERTEVLMVNDDGSVEWAPVERTHTELVAFLPEKYSPDHYFESDVFELAERFELPDVPTVEKVDRKRAQKAEQAVDMIADILSQQGQKLFQFQREDIVKLLTKRFGILAWDPGCGKTIGGLTFALGALAIGDCVPRVLVVAPQDLIPQWFAEIGKFFGAEFAAEWFVVSGIEDAIQLARLSRRVGKTYPLFAITWYEALRDAIGEERIVKRNEGEPCFYCNRIVHHNGLCSYGCPFNGSPYISRRRDAAWFLKKFVRNGVLVIDEGTYIKSCESLRGIAARRLVTAKYRLIMTGTPIKNLLSDLPMLLQLAARPNSQAYPFPPEQEGINRFSKQFMVVERNLLNKRRRIGPEPTNLSTIQLLLSATVLRRRKDQLGEEIAPLEIKVHEVPLTYEQALWYRAWCDDDLFERWFYATHNRNIGDLARLLSRMTHLLFVIGHPTSSTATGSPVPLNHLTDLPTPTEMTHKNLLVVNLAEQFVREEGYCVVFAQTVGVLETIGRMLRERGIPVHMTVEKRAGKLQSLPPAKRSMVIQKLRHQGGILLASISAMAHGHDFAFVPRAIIHSLPFAYDSYAQAICRVHRIVSPKPVEVHVICASNSLDMYLFELLRRKEFAASSVLDNAMLEITISKDEWKKVWEQVQESLDNLVVA